MKNKVLEFEVEKDNIRLDLFLSEKLEKLSRAYIQKLIKNEKVLVDKVIVIKTGYKLKFNQKVQVTIVFEKEIDYLKPFKLLLDIKYEDEYLLIVNKPSGLVVHPAIGHEDKTLVNALIYYNKNLSSIGEDKFRPGIVHRLDKDTSGLLVIAKDDKTHTLLQELIKQKKIKRYYYAIVNGLIKHSKGTIDAPIQRDLSNRKRYIVGDNNGKWSITHFELIKHLKNLSVLKIWLETGRTHQIRVHFKYLNHAIYNDPMYYKIQDKSYEEYGQFLCAYKLEFIHPITKKNINIELEMPKEFKKIIKNNI